MAREIDPRRFRRVMGRFATGVTVITTRDGDAVRGMTATAFMSGSLDPPLCIVSVGKRAQMHSLLLKAGHFGISILADGQEEYSLHFAGRLARTLEIGFEELAGVPVLADACGRIATEIAGRHDCGDHTLFVGHILQMESDDRPPLIYHAGRYGSFDPRGDESVGDLW
jgi:flavin reductase (DIM6/NTAB) family NADH-FMN oxidoreductase RutF